jgi:hypothetical protein
MAFRIQYNHDGESRFVQNGYPKKQKNQAREDWRAHKQFKRNQARNGSIRDGCPPWLKRACHKSNRAWVKKCIKAEKYDLIFSRKDFFDPWLWD